MSVEAIETPKVPLRRGGLHPTYGKFIGGSTLTDEYQLAEVPSGSYFRFFTQQRHEKTIATIERDLRDTRDSIKSIKFNGTLEPTEGSANEIGKERFVTLLEKRVKEYGQQTFYWIRDSDNKVVDLFENAHRFKLDQFFAKHNRRCVKSEEFETYDDIERDEVELSRTVVESLLTEAFQEKLEIRFSHRDDFESLPGSCPFMMVLETCNASVYHDIEGAKKKLEALELNSYPGENVTEFASDAQRLVKVMQAAYSMPLKTGSGIIAKVTNTGSEFFNRKMWALLDTAMTAELEFELSDPKLFLKHKDYATLGPLGVIATIQAMHGMLLSQHQWPALADTLPESKNASVNGTGSGGNGHLAASPLNGRRCFRCNGDHLIRDCPNHAPEGGGSNSGGTGGNRIRTPFAEWKYQKPPDVTVPRVDTNGNIWKFCSKCKCRAIRKVGYYQLSHFDADHIDNYRRHGGSGSRASSNATTAPPEVPTAPTTIAPQSNLTPVANPNPIPPGPPDVTTDKPSTWIANVEDSTLYTATSVLQVSSFLSSVERESVTAEAVNEDNDDDSYYYETDDDGFYPDDFDDGSTATVDYPSTDNDTGDEDNKSTYSDDSVQDKVAGYIKEMKSYYSDSHKEDPLTTAHQGCEAPSFWSSWIWPTPPHWMIRMVRLWSFWIAMLFWDTVLYFVAASSDLPPFLCRIRRRKQPSTIAAYPSNWLIFSGCIMLLMSIFQGAAPSIPIADVSDVPNHLYQEVRLYLSESHCWMKWLS